MSLIASPFGRAHWRRNIAVFVGGVVAAAGLATGLSAGFGAHSPPAAASSASYDYYRSVVGTSGPRGMMGGGTFGSSSWLMGRSGYAWMMGGADAPGWMRGQNLPGWMLRGNPDPGSVMGRLFADAPGKRVSPAAATRLGNEVPAGATANVSAKRLRFATEAVHFVVLASPSMPNESFRIAGMTNPTVVVPKGARVSIELVNADSDMAHGLVLDATGAGSSWMPMMSGAPAFVGAELWFLGEATSAGMHVGTLSFTASAPGSYQYLCPVPGHAKEGMVGRFVVSSAR